MITDKLKIEIFCGFISVNIVRYIQSLYKEELQKYILFVPGFLWACHFTLRKLLVKMYNNKNKNQPS